MAEPITIQQCQSFQPNPEKTEAHNKMVYDKLVKYGIFDIINTILIYRETINPGWTECEIRQDDVVKRISKKHPQYNLLKNGEDKMIDDDLLEFDIFYVRNGWSVKYQQQGMESEYAYWKFKKA
jgi:hypothetical protein